MLAAIDRLRTLKVSDVMSKSVVQVSKNQTMEEVANELLANDVSSAPVVDEVGRCVGMLSAADFLKRDCNRRERGETSAGLEGHSLVRDEAQGSLRIVAGCDAVSSYMSDGVQSIAADASLLDASRVMNAAHIHHLPVFDGEQVVGIVSTMDIVAAVLNATDESESCRTNDS